MGILGKLRTLAAPLVLSSAVALSALPASAAEEEAANGSAPQCGVSFLANITTDYIFRGISFSDNGAAVQTFTTLSCGIFYAGLFTANVEFPGAGANVELTPFVGVAPSYGGFDFNFIGYYYTFPDFGGDEDYFELEAGVKRQVTDNLNLGIRYSHAFFDGFFGLEDTDTVQVDASLALPGLGFRLPAVGDVSTTFSAAYGYETQDITGGGSQDYNYWNAGFRFGLTDNYSFDVRYWDTDEGIAFCQAFNTCDARVVATLSIAF